MALLLDGTVKAWGRNSHGQLGLGNTVHQTAPQPIPSLAGVVAVAAGKEHSMALLSLGTVMVWGRNGNSQLGLGNSVDRHSPQFIPCLNLNSNGNSYRLLISPFGAGAVGFTIPRNTEVSALGGTYYYFNAFSLDPLNTSAPGGGLWHGLHISQTDLIAWMNLATVGLPIAFGALGASGEATATVPVPPAALSGITLHGVSIALNPATTTMVADSDVSSYTF